MINIKHLKVSYSKQTVVDIDHYAFNTSCLHGIIGLNGAGKTSFFNALCQYINRPEEQVSLNGKGLTRNDIGYLETVNYFYPNITGKEYLSLFKNNSVLIHQQALIELFELPCNRVIESYSTGMKKKLAFIAIACQDKPVYIFDEPFNGLDLESNKMLELIIRKMLQAEKTIFISSHILSPLVTLCSEIHLLRNKHFEKHYVPENFHTIHDDLFAGMEKKVDSLLGKQTTP
jgi:ABC-2 type transport system ATP-binding protein